MADAVMICTLDQLHTECVVEFARLGYHMMCEKPMAITPKDCAMMTKAIREAGVIFAVNFFLTRST